MRERRKEKKSFSCLIDLERGKAIEKHLQETNKTKTQWLSEKIDQDTKN